MDDSDDSDTTNNTETSMSAHHNDADDHLDSKTRERILENEMRSFRNAGFHDGYDEGKRSVIQGAFDDGYQKAFEQNFILSTLKGVAHALKSSYNLTINSKTSSTTSTPSPTTSRITINNDNISSNHLSILESMKFDDAGDIESIKNDLIRICRENRLEILAHYVSQIG